MRKAIFLVGMFFVLLISLAQAQSAPIQIYTCQDLQNINKYGIGSNGYGTGVISENFQLANDIDCSATNPADPNNATSIWNNGIGFLPIGFNEGSPNAFFTGTFDGAGHTISNLYINFTPSPSLPSIQDNQDFGFIVGIYNGTVKNLNIKNATIIGPGNSVGVLTGGIAYGNVSNVHLQGTINAGGNAGGIAPNIATATIVSSSADVAITSAGTTGGLIGYVSESSFGDNYIVQSYAKGSINTTGTGIGGLVGSCGGAEDYKCISITDSYATVAINRNCSAAFPTDFTAGGLVGNTSDIITTITNSYAAGPITMTGTCQYLYIGGLIGNQNYGGHAVVTNSYWDTQVTGQATSVGSSSSAGLSTAQMFLQSSYINWDFNNTWVSDSQHYPALRAQEQSQIDLWKTFDAVIQENIFEFANTPANTVDWNAINGAYAAGTNWVDLQVMSQPPVWNNQSVTLNTINWTYLSAMSDNPINWVDVAVLTRTGIDWASVNPLVRSGINWIDWAVSSDSGINWGDVSAISLQGINWTNLGTLCDAVNWSSLAGLSREGINWGLVSGLSHSRVNWDSTAILNAVRLSPDTLHTLRTIGVEHAPSPIQNVQLTLYLQGAGVGTITSLPAGINCTSGVGAGCAASFPVNQPVTLIFAASGHAMITNWGGCVVNSPTSCTVSPDQNISLDITVTPMEDLLIQRTGTGTGTLVISTPSTNAFNCNQALSCANGYPAGTFVTLIAVPVTGSTFTGWTGVTSCTTQNPCTFKINNNVSATANFVKTYTITTNIDGNGSGKILCNGSTCPASVPAGTWITFSGQPNPGSVFIALDGNFAAPGGPIFTSYTQINGNITASGYFIKGAAPAPSGLKIVSSATEVSLSWKASQYAPYYYNVHRVTVNLNGITNSVVNLPYSSTSYKDTTIHNKGLYLYYVTAQYYPATYSATSNIVSVNWAYPNKSATPSVVTAS